MKQLLLFVCSLSYLAANGQQRALYLDPAYDIAVPQQKIAHTGIEAPEHAYNPLPRPAHMQMKGISQVDIGTTIYDLQSNSSVQNRSIYYSDGTFGAAFTYGDNDPSFDDRGAGYNYHDGTNWGSHPTARVESTRNGWPSLMYTGNSTEAIISHSTGGGFTLNKRSTKGSGAWTESVITTNIGHWMLWPRATAGGNNGTTLHCIGITAPVGNGGTPYMGVDGALLYYRSQDEGATWDIVDFQIADLDSTNFNNFRADSYSIIADGDNVAIAVFNQWADMILLKSSDNGGTWTSQIVNDFPIDLYVTDQGSDWNGDQVYDTLETCDEAGSIIFDQAGMVHMTFGRMRVLDADTTDGNTSYFPGTQELYYWNENMGTGNFTTIAVPEDVDGDQQLGYAGAWALYYTALCGQPTMGMDANGTIFVGYSSYREDLFTFDQNFRHIYLTKSFDGGMTWQTPFNVTPDPFFVGYECVFPTLATSVDDKVRLTYMRDFEPGLAVRGDMDVYDANEIMFLCTDTTFIDDAGIEEIVSLGLTAGIAPNPASEIGILSMELESSLTGTIALYDGTGKMVEEIASGNFDKGTHMIDIDVNDLKNGTYYVRSEFGDYQLVNEIVVIH